MAAAAEGVTKSLDGGSVWGANKITTSTTVGDNPDGSHAARLTNYPVSNLKNPLRTKTTRVTYNDNVGASYDITFVFGTAISLTSFGIAFVDWNLPKSSSTITIHAGSSTSYGTTWGINPYVGDNGVARYYLSTPTSGSASTATHWKVSFAGDYSIVESYLEIGKIVFSNYIDLTIATPFGRTLNDPSVYASSYSGQVYADPKLSYNTITMSTSPMSSSTMYPLQESLRGIGVVNTIVDIHGSSASTDGGNTVDVLDKASSYYGRLHKGIKSNIQGYNNTKLGLSFSEARK